MTRYVAVGHNLARLSDSMRVVRTMQPTPSCGMRRFRGRRPIPTRRSTESSVASPLRVGWYGRRIADKTPRPPKTWPVPRSVGAPESRRVPRFGRSPREPGGDILLGHSLTGAPRSHLGRAHGFTHGRARECSAEILRRTTSAPFQVHRSGPPFLAVIALPHSCCISPRHGLTRPWNPRDVNSRS